MKKLILDKLPEYGTDDIYHDLTQSKSYSGRDFSTDKETIDAINNSVDILAELVYYLEDNELIL